MFIYLFFLLISIENLFASRHCLINETFYLTKNQTNIYFDISSNCHIQLIINYDNNIQMKFYPIKNLSNISMRFYSTIEFFNNKEIITSTIDYICLEENLCDINKYIQRIYENNLNKNLISIWNNSNICQKKSKTDFCESYLCFFIYNELQNFRCHKQFLTNTIEMNIKTKTDNIIHEYHCRKNHCKGEVLYNLNNQNNSTDISKIKPMKRNYLDWKKILITIGILLFIGSIAYYIQCRKYNQGYKLTVNA